MKADIAETPLIAVIRENIKASQYAGQLKSGKRLSAIPFQQYMMLCLYHPEFGYYRSGTSRIGRAGDFYTSSFVGDLMGEQLAAELARLAAEWFPAAEQVEVLDWGGGTGRLGRQMLDTWAEENNQRFTLTVIEGNSEHRRMARENLEAYIQRGKASVASSEEGENIDFSNHPVIVVANELLDALPVHRLVWQNGHLWEWGVAWEERQGFAECLLEPINPLLAKWLNETHLTLLNNQTIEINLDADQWVATLLSRLEQAIMVFIDYGDETEELISPHRMDGTLLCYYKHRAHNNPYLLPGEQDLTAHVNFSRIRQCAVRSGCKELWYGSQKNFLVQSGIMNKLSAHTITDPFHPVVRRNRAIRQLLLSDGMSELFKVQVLLKCKQ